ncbi:Dihydrodipicolinate synthase [Scheffersomyces stipitis CBS 6054]|uniref:Dihydrodipicolinate synthase n=1 Tax=Scheffersomyces stipitis (strain ATCC 58785 / CBS 6054 / NBRC 10063 / NRRL Y-11545) TaxID=322104 RepID=A3LQR8_PICST|nr:Dihydrodipicolinate synthase [Scheffersomyces stipitis CBS 6054]ABN65617.2 Dihydrodipicolinate synthase [Scheffersomyces stipitis CBS 6054]
MTILPASVLPEGIYTPITTFFKNDADYTLDLESQVEHAKFLYDRGISGLVVAGSMGETPHLSRQERSALVSSLRMAIPDENFKIIAGAPPIGNIEEAIEEIDSARDAGADFMILLVPGYFGPKLISQEGIVDYFLKVADKSSLPIVIYNYPGTSNNVTITLDSFKKLSVHEKIVAVKLTHFNLDLYTMLGRDSELCQTNNFRPFTGLGQVLIPALSVGIYGAIDGMSALFPKVMVKLLTLFKEGKLKESSELQYLVTKADMMIMELNVVGVKHALKQFYGFGESLTGRPPLSKEVDLNAYSKYQADLNTLDKIEKSL